MNTRDPEYVTKRIQRLSEKIRELEDIAPDFIMPRGNTAKAALQSSRTALKRWLRIRNEMNIGE
jgi:cob(I)alamin adenosyltransferase